MKYPQSLFALRIAELIPQDTKTVVDAPCGRGQTTYNMAARFPDVQFVGADIDGAAITFARQKQSLPNIEFVKQGIHELVDEAEIFDVFCLINSLFLLPEPQSLLRKIAGKLSPQGKLILVIPNSDSENFKRFQKYAPEVNKFILERENFEGVFNSLGLKMQSCVGAAKIPTFGRRDTKLLYPIRDRYLFWLENRSVSKSFGYYVIELAKAE